MKLPSRRAVLSARLNARLNGVTVTAVRGDMFRAVGDDHFDLIVSNPPYLPSADGRLPRRGVARAWEAGPLGRVCLDRICAEAPRHLKAKGVLLLVQSSVCGERETVAALSQHGLQSRVVARRQGPLGPRLRVRQDWLRERGLVSGDGREEILVIRAERPRS